MERHWTLPLICGLLALMPANVHAEAALSCGQVVERLSADDKALASKLASAPQVQTRGEAGTRLSWTLPFSTELAINCTTSGGASAIMVYADPPANANAASALRDVAAKAVCAVLKGTPQDCAAMFDQTLARSRTTGQVEIFANLPGGLSLEFANAKDQQELSIDAGYDKTMSDGAKPLSIVWVDGNGKPVP